MDCLTPRLVQRLRAQVAELEVALQRQPWPLAPSLAALAWAR